MTDARQPKDPEGGALLWSVDGTLTIRRTAASYRVIFIEDTMGGDGTQSFDAQQDDIESFIDQLKRLMGSY